MDSSLPKEKTMDDFYALYKQHCLDDAKAFESIKERQEKHEELTKINGEHMSSIRVDLTEVKKILLNQNETQRESNERLTRHIELVAPILAKYQDEQATKRVLKGYGKGAVGTGAVIGAYHIIKKFFIE